MKKYSGFTLIEMLIVMGIIIILMAAGIAGGRFALQRANRIQKQSAVDNIEQALWGYYTDKRQFPTGQNPRDLLTSGGDLHEYVDAGQLDGGADGDFAYFVNTITHQEFVVCATLGGHGDSGKHGVYCTGNGLDVLAPFNDSPHTLPPDNVYAPDHSNYDNVEGSTAGFWSPWYGETRSWVGP